MGLAGAAVAHGDDVLSEVHVLAACQLHDQVLVHRGMARKSKVSRLFTVGKRAALILRSTIRNAIYTIQVKLGVASKQEVVVWAVRNGQMDD